MLVLLYWWLTIQLLGLSVLPLTRYVFRWLPDEGYAFARPLGILLSSYLLWLGASLGLVDNSSPTIIVIVLLLAALSWLWLGQRVGSTLDWWRRNRGTIITVELLFAAALIVMALLRAYDPAISLTEKPMEFGFLNAIMRGDSFPPADPWMSGHSISYYYFGYVMTSVLSKLSGLGANYTFNLMTATLFALTMTGGYAVVSNMVRMASKRWSKMASWQPTAFGLLGGWLVAVMGNLEGIVELLNSHGLLPTMLRGWLHIKDLPVQGVSNGWLPGDWMWWWRASRVIGSFDPSTGASTDYTITEFPFFSFLLGDLHPHVLALPFVIMCLGLTLNLLASKERLSLAWLWKERRIGLILMALTVGALGFLNTWDLPTLLLTLTMAYGIRQYWQSGRFGRPQLRETVLFAMVTLALGLLLFTPFYPFLGSQAKGIGLVAVRTQPHHFFLFWGPMLFPVAIFLISRLASFRHHHAQNENRRNILFSWKWSVIGLIVVLCFLNAATLAMLVLGLVAVVLLLKQWLGQPQPTAGSSIAETRTSSSNTSTGFVDGDPGSSTGWTLSTEARASANHVGPVMMLLLLLVPIMLLAGTELFFIHDFFGNRMNTMFKVYYQSWAMLALATAYMVFYLTNNKSPKLGGWFNTALSRVAVGSFIILALAGTFYPVAASISKSNGFAAAPVLDGMAYMETANQYDYQAIQWLNDTVQGTPVILEAPGTSYSAFSRISANTGLPTVIGWVFHETQWRGSNTEATQRQKDVDTIYKTTDMELAKNLLRKYNVNYVYIGELERKAYEATTPASLTKFSQFMDTVYSNPGVTIYQLHD